MVNNSIISYQQTEQSPLSLTHRLFLIHIRYSPNFRIISGMC